jgi:aspartate kinase
MSLFLGETMKVVKIGGAIFSDFGKVPDIKEIFNRYAGVKIVVVISAAGKTTAWLKELANSAKNNQDYDNIINRLKRFYKIQLERFELDTFVLQNLEEHFTEIKLIADSIAVTGECSLKVLDRLLSFGEIITGVIFTAYLRKENIDFRFISAPEIIKTNDDFGKATPLRNEIKKNIDTHLLPNFAETDLIITQGFIASNLDSIPTTMGFESSNLTAVLIAENIDVDEIELWTTTQGILQIDPTYDRFAKSIDYMDYKSAIELADAGMNLLHKDMLVLAEKLNIKLKYSSAFYPDGKHTIIGEFIEKYSNPVVIVKLGEIADKNIGGDIIKINNYNYSFAEYTSNPNAYKFTIFNINEAVVVNVIKNNNLYDLLINEKEKTIIYFKSENLENMLNLISM